MLYVIAGSSLSGKTSSRHYITKSRGISGIDSDTLRTMMNDLRPDITIGHTRDPLTNYEGMRPCIQAFIHARSFFEEDYILEGDGIHLEDIKQNVKVGKMRAIILGYPNDSAENRLALLQQYAPASHWSCRVTAQVLSEKIQQCIEYSIFLQYEAKKLGLDFVDVSATKNVNDVIVTVLSHLFLD